MGSGLTRRNERVNEVLDELGLAEDHCVVNLSVGGYGMDQAILMYEQTIARFEHLNPVVVFAMVTESDFGRANLAFRSHPKPRFVRRKEGWELVPPLALDSASYMARHPPRMRSYAWNLLLHGTKLPSRWTDKRSGKTFWKKKKPR